MILTFSALLLTIALVALAARRVSHNRHRVAARAAAEPAVIDGEAVDVAELIWSVRQATHAPTMQTIGSSVFGSAERVLDAVSEMVDALPPDQRLDLITTRARLQQTREAREILARTADSLAATAGPAAADVLIVGITEAIGTSVIGEAVTRLMPSLLETVLPHTNAGVLLDVPGAEHVLEVVAPMVGEVVGDAVVAVLDAHVPVLTIVTALHRANQSRKNGLEAGRIGENLGWDIGAKGGSIFAGAAVGSAIFPVVGTVVGALVGATVGSHAAHLGKHRHLAEAHRQLLASVEALGLSVNNKILIQLLTESERMLSIKRQRCRTVSSEAADMVASLSWRQRVFQPTVGGKIADLVVQLAGADIRYEESLHNALRRTIARSAGSPIARAYLWTAGQHLLGWQTFTGPDASDLEDHINRVAQEQNKLTFAE